MMIKIKAIKMLLAGCMALMCACQPSQKSQMYTVTGELDDSTHHGKKIYVMRYDDNQMIARINKEVDVSTHPLFLCPYPTKKQMKLEESFRKT